jgi:hypothetical protein
MSIIVNLRLLKIDNKNPAWPPPVCPVEPFWLFIYRNLRIYQIFFASSFSIIKQLMPALAVNIIIVHLWDVVFPRENNTPRVNNYDV